MDLYREDVLDHYNNPRNMGELSGDNVLAARETNASCGDSVEYYLRVEGGRIVEIKWRGAGCAIMTASASKLSEWLQGLTLKEVGEMGEQEMADVGVGLRVGPGRARCVLVPIRAVTAILS